MKRFQASLLLPALLAASLQTASALPFLAIDLDVNTPGIQPSRTVTLGSPSFSIAAVYVGDGTATFDTFLGSLNFNDNGAVLGLQGGTGTPTAGALADLAPVMTLDVLAGTLVVSTDPLTTGASSRALGFSADSGLLGLNSIGDPFPIIANNVAVEILRLNLIANSLVTSTLTLFNGTGPLLALTTLLPDGSLDTVAVPATLATSTLTVIERPTPGIPEPSSLLVFAAGLSVLVMRRLGERSLGSSSHD